MINKNEMTKIVNFMQTWRSSAKLVQPVEQCHFEQLNLFTPVFLRSELQPVLDRRARSGLGIFVTCPFAFPQRRLAQNAHLVLGPRHFSFKFPQDFFFFLAACPCNSTAYVRTKRAPGCSPAAFWL